MAKKKVKKLPAIRSKIQLPAIHPMEYQLGQLIYTGVMGDLYPMRIIGYTGYDEKYQVGWTNGSPGSFWVRKDEIRLTL